MSYIVFRTHVVFCVIVARHCDQIKLNSSFLKHIQFMIHNIIHRADLIVANKPVVFQHILFMMLDLNKDQL